MLHKDSVRSLLVINNQYYQNIKKTEVLNYEKLMMGVFISHHQLFMLYSCEA